MLIRSGRCQLLVDLSVAVVVESVADCLDRFASRGKCTVVCRGAGKPNATLAQRGRLLRACAYPHLLFTGRRFNNSKVSSLVRLAIAVVVSRITQFLSAWVDRPAGIVAVA